MLHYIFQEIYLKTNSQRYGEFLKDFFSGLPKPTINFILGKLPLS